MFIDVEYVVDADTKGLTEIRDKLEILTFNDCKID